MHTDPKLGAYELRTRQRVEGDWIATLWRPKDGVFIRDNYDGPTPRGYQTVQDCKRCHRDAGLDQSLIRPRLAGWRGKVRGSDGILTWHPFEVPKSGFKMEPVLRKDAEDKVRFRQPNERIDRVEWLEY